MLEQWVHGHRNAQGNAAEATKAKSDLKPPCCHPLPASQKNSGHSGPQARAGQKNPGAVLLRIPTPAFVSPVDVQLPALGCCLFSLEKPDSALFLKIQLHCRVWEGGFKIKFLTGIISLRKANHTEQDNYPQNLFSMHLCKIINDIFLTRIPI